MTLAPDAKGKPRRVIIQLVPMLMPFSQGWVGNIRALATAHWYDGIAVVRVQDNYVVQWGDPDGEDAGKAKPLPGGLKTVLENDYVGFPIERRGAPRFQVHLGPDAYAPYNILDNGWPIAGDGKNAWPIHCYGMVGVGRNLSPDTGTGAELYAVIGQAPRQLDRNIALVGRIVEGMEHLSSLPRGTGDIGFYKTPEERTPILSVRIASDLPVAEQPHLQYLSTETEVFVRYADARANRRDPFYIRPVGGADICNIPVPIRRKP
jgi:peptidylprolyl isomerase